MSERDEELAAFDHWLAGYMREVQGPATFAVAQMREAWLAAREHCDDALAEWIAKALTRAHFRGSMVLSGVYEDAKENYMRVVREAMREREH